MKKQSKRKERNKQKKPAGKAILSGRLCLMTSKLDLANERNQEGSSAPYAGNGGNAHDSAETDFGSGGFFLFGFNGGDSFFDGICVHGLSSRSLSGSMILFSSQVLFMISNLLSLSLC